MWTCRLQNVNIQALLPLHPRKLGAGRVSPEPEAPSQALTNPLKARRSLAGSRHPLCVCVCVCSVHTHVCTRALSPPPRAFCVHGFVQAGIGNTQKQRPRDFPAAQCDAAGLRAHAESTRTGHAQAHACARTRTWPRTRVISHAFPSPSRSPETELPARQTPCAA